MALGDGYGVCSHRCEYGGTVACNPGERPGFCFFAAVDGAFGDIGYCAELCDCDGECAHPDSICDPFSSEAVRELTGKGGVCAPRSAGDGIACP